MTGFITHSDGTITYGEATLGIPGISKLADDKIRELVCKCPGGSYSTRICRHCGIYRVSAQGDYQTAEITDKCALCYDTEPYIYTVP